MMWNLKLMAAIGIATTISLAGTAWYAYSKGKQSGMQEVQTLWIAERAAIREAQAKEMEQARQREEALQARVDQIRRSHRNEISRINRDHAALVDSLRDRPEARAGDSGVPDGAAAGVGCTGAGLARLDAELLSGYAAAAARQQAALNACVTAYDEVRRSLNNTQ
jgi:hypothetical protein